MGRFSKLWREAGQSLGFGVRPKGHFGEEPEPEERVLDRPAPEDAHATATAGWIHTAGNPVFTKVRFSAESDDVLLMPKSPPLDTPLWVISEARAGEPYFIQSSERTEDGFRVTAYRNKYRRTDSARTTSLGRADLLWVDDEGAVASASVALENGEPGEVVVTVGEPVSAPAVVLLAGYEYRGLGSVKQCDAEGENFKLSVEIAEELFLKSNAA